MFYYYLLVVSRDDCRLVKVMASVCGLWNLVRLTYCEFEELNTLEFIFYDAKHREGDHDEQS